VSQVSASSASSVGLNASIARARTAPVRFDAGSARGRSALSSVTSVVLPDHIVGAVISRIGMSANASIE
jgi:hypothetical protein